MATDRQRAANKANAKKSTGPLSKEGKRQSSRNALTHGLLSRELLLPNESAGEFNELFSRLVTELGAVGTLEMALVERIAIAIWRQRRLVRAERIYISTPVVPERDQADRPRVHIITMVKAIERLPLDLLNTPEYENKLDDVERELKLIHLAGELTAPEFARRYPNLVRLFPFPDRTAWALDTEPTFGKVHDRPEFIAMLLSEVMRLRGLRDEQRNGLAPHFTRPEVDKQVRYQSALDNEWYKAMRALREAQAARLRTITAHPLRDDGGAP